MLNIRSDVCISQYNSSDPRGRHKATVLRQWCNQCYSTLRKREHKIKFLKWICRLESALATETMFLGSEAEQEEFQEVMFKRSYSQSKWNIIREDDIRSLFNSDTHLALQQVRGIGCLPELISIPQTHQCSICACVALNKRKIWKMNETDRTGHPRTIFVGYTQDKQIHTYFYVFCCCLPIHHYGIHKDEASFRVFIFSRLEP